MVADSGNTSTDANITGGIANNVIEQPAANMDKVNDAPLLETTQTTAPKVVEDTTVWPSHGVAGDTLSSLYSENVTAKILRAAEDCLRDNSPPTAYPEVVLQSGETQGEYTRRPANFWTCGFFPGTIWALVERAIKYPQSMRHEDTRVLFATVRDRLETLGVQWSDPLTRQAHRTDTHDLGFMILPHMRRRWELFHSKEALATIITAATSLYSRYNTRVGAIRAWDVMHWVRGSEIRCTKENFLVIIDSLCNLELLYYAAAHSGYTFLADAATAHAKTLMRTHLRHETGRSRAGYEGVLYSSNHVVNFSPHTGEIQKTFTAQGHTATTTWARGQAWAIMGYAQAYSWTKDQAFLDASLGCAEYFLLRLEDAPSCVEVLKKTPAEGETPTPIVPLTRASAGTGRFVPLWDFDAPIENEANPLRDASAGVAAANGMLILAQILLARGRAAQAERYLQSALVIVEDTLLLCLSDEQVLLDTKPGVALMVTGRDPAKKPFHSILTGSTVSWNEHFTSRTGDHGLVYADYYLVEFGNRLLQLSNAMV